MEQDLAGAAAEPTETGNEPVSTEPDTGKDVQQDGEFQGDY